MIELSFAFSHEISMVLFRSQSFSMTVISEKSKGMALCCGIVVDDCTSPVVFSINTAMK